MRSDSTRIWSWYTIQRACAAAALVVLLPLFAVLFLAVRLTSRGPFLYRQERPGRGGRPFRVWKIRTMRPGSDRDASRGLVVKAGDPSVTRVGRILRELKLDELPQLWNVVRGEMAIVGPRPIAWSLHTLLRERIPGFDERLDVRPGLTSVSQVTLFDNAEDDGLIDDWTRRFDGERHYIRHRGPLYDAVVIGLTVGYLIRKVLRKVRRRRDTALVPGGLVGLQFPVDGGGGNPELTGRLGRRAAG